MQLRSRETLGGFEGIYVKGKENRRKDPTSDCNSINHWLLSVKLSKITRESASS